MDACGEPIRARGNGGSKLAIDNRNDARDVPTEPLGERGERFDLIDGIVFAVGQKNGVVAGIVRFAEVDAVPVVGKFPRAKHGCGNVRERFFRFGVALGFGDVNGGFAVQAVANQIREHGSATAIRRSEENIKICHRILVNNE